MNQFEKFFGSKVAGTRVVPIVTKIVALFAVLMLVSNFASNFINLTLNRGELLLLAKRLLVKDLKELYTQASNQYDIFEFSRDMDEALATMTEAAGRELAGQRSFAAGVRADGSFLFWSSKDNQPPGFSDEAALKTMRDAQAADDAEGILYFKLNGRQYFSLYKYIAKWDAYLIRAEEESEFYEQSRVIFGRVSLIIVVMTVICVGVGIVLVGRILRFVNRFAHELMRMQQEQKLELIDLSEAPNDDVTYLGASFNSLASTINNLLVIFKRFVTQDVAQRAYAERKIKLEGTTKELSILFTDIKGFTFITETLGNDIIDLLNLHYDKAIWHIHYNEGIVGSIIGDALLAVFGTLDGKINKSVASLHAAFRIQQVASDLRKAMKQKSDTLIEKRGELLPAEQKVLKAIMLEVGVGIDGGEVFYGNIGSYERMTNTVIGDNVNSASRLEGLTRLYHVPVVCSQYIKDEVEQYTNEYRFVELDQVQVKGKLEGKRIYWPIPGADLNPELERELTMFERGLQAYYRGDWNAASIDWDQCAIPPMQEFKLRLSQGCPEGWNGIWAMTTK